MRKFSKKYKFSKILIDNFNYNKSFFNYMSDFFQKTDSIYLPVIKLTNILCLINISFHTITYFSVAGVYTDDDMTRNYMIRKLE